MSDRLDLDALERLEREVDATRWRRSDEPALGGVYYVVREDGERIYHQESVDFAIALRNAAPELLRLARIGQAREDAWRMDEGAKS